MRSSNWSMKPNDTTTSVNMAKAYHTDDFERFISRLESSVYL